MRYQTPPPERPTFLPMSRYEMQRLGWDVCDVVLMTGDAYIDHPSYGVAVIARLIEAEGLRVGIIAQPHPSRVVDFTQLGKPRYFFGVTSGCADSMINNYSPTKRPRKFDNFSAGRIPGRRPDHAVVAYASTLKRIYPDVPVVLGGIEASLRRLAHYDYFDDEVKMSALSESGADLLVFGQGEKATREIVRVFVSGKGARGCRDIRGLAFRAGDDEDIAPHTGGDEIELPDFDAVAAEKMNFFNMAKADIKNIDPYTARPLVQRYGDHRLVINRPQPPMTTEELDEIYELPYVRTPHPKYKKQGAIPAFETVKFSLMTHRGCFGGCSFCPIYFHQGHHVTSRSEKGILDEANQVSKFRYFRGVISNIGGPMANMYQTQCSRVAGRRERESCSQDSCMYPEPCRNMKTDQRPYLELLQKILAIENVEQAFLASHVRYDLLEGDPCGQELLELILKVFSGPQFKCSPMHVSDAVIRRLRKYPNHATERFVANCSQTLKKIGADDVELVPYFMASHPGSTMEDALEVAQFMDERGIAQCQIHDFVPIPGTASACMYYTGMDPYTGETMYRPLSHRERKLQRALLQFYKPENARFVYEALIEAGRTDLIGDGPGCLLRAAPDEVRPPIAAGSHDEN
ncbi:YgiQ family radical SAM protein [bacterium]|nr:YgiQ family radical SAM protein [bacterium]